MLHHKSLYGLLFVSVIMGCASNSCKFYKVAGNAEGKFLAVMGLGVNVPGVDNFEEIYTDIERYKGLVDVVIINDEEDFAKTEIEAFNNALRLFSQLIGDDTYEEPERIDEDIPLDNSNRIDSDSDSDSVIGSDSN